LAVLRELPQVTSLNLRRAPLSDAAVAEIAALPRLAAVEIDSTPITVAALNKLRQQKPQVRVYARGAAQLGILADMSGPCRVTGVVQGSGAAEAGLKEGDEIFAVENRRVRDFSDLTIAIFGRQAGEKLRLACNRDGKELNVDVVLRERQQH
jgi:S1-C subfamily serine protease